MWLELFLIKEERHTNQAAKNKSKVKAKHSGKTRANVRIRRNNALEYYKILADNNSLHSSSEKEKNIVNKKTEKPTTKGNPKAKVQKRTPDQKRFNNESDIHSDSTPITNNSKNPGESNQDDTTIKKTISQKDKNVKPSEKKEIREKIRSEGKEIVSTK